MTTGRRGNKSYTGHHGVPEDRLRALDKMRRTPAGQAEAITPPSQDALRRAVDAQTCPWCAAGPFKVLAAHVHRAHGLDRFEFRELLGVTRSAPIADPEHSRCRSEALKGKPVPERLRGPTSGRKRQYNTAGRVAQRAKLDSIRVPEWAAAGGAAAAARTRAANAEKYARIVALWSEGNLNFAEIGALVGMHARTVRNALRERGLIEGDGRAIRWTRTPHPGVAAANTASDP